MLGCLEKRSMSKHKLSLAINILCEIMHETDANEFMIEVGLEGGEADGARYIIRILREQPEEIHDDNDIQ
jgi:hypothetical protein